jgi:hypothetical protein
VDAIPSASPDAIAPRLPIGFAGARSDAILGCNGRIGAIADGGGSALRHGKLMAGNSIENGRARMRAL